MAFKSTPNPNGQGLKLLSIAWMGGDIAFSTLITSRSEAKSQAVEEETWSRLPSPHVSPPFSVQVSSLLKATTPPAAVPAARPSPARGDRAYPMFGRPAGQDQPCDPSNSSNSYSKEIKESKVNGHF